MIDLSSTNIVPLDYATTSKGNQKKYYDYKNNLYIKSQFDYQGKLWNDHLVERLSSIIGEQLRTKVPLLRQDIVELSDGTSACVSSDFALDKEWVPMSKLCDYKKLNKDFGKPYKLFLQFINVFVKLGIPMDLARDYFTVMIVMDYLLCNEDRHYNNFGLLRDKFGNYELAPLFDFGLGLFEHDRRYANVDLITAKSLIEGKPFSSDLHLPVNMLFTVLDLNYLRNLLGNISVPDRDLFPNELGYLYFLEAFNKLQEALNV